ncbi:glycoside hydrolase/phage tail family protein [Lichenihabitans sp. PAMC28606]|uniref:baseplate multidomain protein megatron n=1 Tax=Lichenihabitans sp. PAMC28606 TaxID=2880932 RepID=UPI001D0A9F8C|nr:glycoside hydrolase/phage tail family protein [Lichenihabitans sp. PAMC28606]UDL93981.1 glycoside hydrolase/phage tail family protein [Lichenihabitans sp. PAMC28606]
MATLVLRAAGAAVGTALGGPVGGLIGGALGTVSGAVVDSLLINALTPRRSNPQLSSLAVTNSAENTTLHKLWGRMRLGGNVIWCTQFSVGYSHVAAASGKGSLLTPKTKVTHDSLSFAVAFCEGGDNVSLGRVWADGNLLDMSKYPHRFYNGSESQEPDSLIESIEGAGRVPAYRGTCYLVFDTMVLDDFGNRMPQITAEIIRRPDMIDGDDVVSQLKAVCLLPGAGEFVLGTLEYQSSDGFGTWYPENQHQKTGLPDFYGSMDELAAALPGRQAISLVVSWFGTDLRAGTCQIVPKVETRQKTVKPADWTVSTYTRATAPLVSQIDTSAFDPNGTGLGTSPAFGGTPSDDTVTQAIRYMNQEGIRVMFYPFIMLDVPAGNRLPDPHGGAEQAAFPWRGRITCFPGPGQAGSADKTSAAATQVAAFFAQYTPMVLHYASLTVAAGGVDAFVIGSELVGLTQVRAGDGSYPAVAALKALAGQVKAIVGSACRVGYAADWSEYHSHRPADGSDDVIFNMDPLWSDPAIDFIGIDNYLPLSDWRDGSANLDASVNGGLDGGPTTIYDKAYLGRNVEGGEDYDWYYASPADRVAQRRSPITDGAYGEPWVFRQKDIRAWWSTAHHDRPGGVRAAASTAYAPQGKPIWFTEFGCPAIDKGSNQPNVFYDPKSSESDLPYFSLGSKDDAIQRTYLEVTLSYWRDHAPISILYGRPMVEAANMFAWAWDARPYPDFPGLTGVWHDTPNYELGHWLTGRLEAVPLKWIIAELCAAVGVTAFDTSRLLSASTLVPGYATDALASPRDILAGLMDAFQFDACESGGVVRFFARGNVQPVALTEADLVVDGDTDPGYHLVRTPETDLPGAVRISFADPFRNYATGAVEARKPNGSSQTVATVSTAAALDQTYAAEVAMTILQQTWSARETASIKLPPSAVAIDPGDAVTLTIDGVTLPFRVKQVETSTYRSLELIGFDPSLLKVALSPDYALGGATPGAFGPPIVEIMDLPLVTGQEDQPWAPRIAAFASPWSGTDIYRQNGAGGFDIVTTVDTPSVMGVLTGPLYAGPAGRWDRGNTLSVRFFSAAGLLSLTDAQVLAGGGALAVKNDATGQWEVVQYAVATLTGVNSYNLTRLLRGQLGTEAAMAAPSGAPMPAGARVVMLDQNRFGVLTTSLDNRAMAQTLRYGPSSGTAADTTFTTITVQPQGIGLRPWSVSQIAAARQPSGDVVVTWVRRTRFGGDSWDPDVVPLNEDSESYDLAILATDGSVIRSVTALGGPTWTYAAVDQVADSGAAPPALTIRIAQRSALFGPGQTATRRVTL